MLPAITPWSGCLFIWLKYLDGRARISVLAIWPLRRFPYSCFLYSDCSRGWETAWTLRCSPHRHEDLSLVLRTQRKSPRVECIPVTQCWGSKDTWVHGISWLAILAYLHMQHPTPCTHVPPTHPANMHPHHKHAHMHPPHTPHTCIHPHAHAWLCQTWILWRYLDSFSEMVVIKMQRKRDP